VGSWGWEDWRGEVGVEMGGLEGRGGKLGIGLTIVFLMLQVWQSYSVAVRSDCGGVSGGLVLPWYPHASSNSSASQLTIHISLLAPPPLNHTTPPYILLWSSSECSLTLTVTPDPLALLDKLAIVHTPILLPWVTALCFVASVQTWSLKFELLLAVLAFRGLTK
jgi:hypothetical protein